MRFRTLYLIGGSVAVVAALLASDPDRGISTVMLLLALVTPLLAVLFTHLSRKALHDYPEADMRKLFARAGETSTGAGLALVALSIVLYGLLGLFGRAAHAQDVRVAIPAAALAHRAVLAREVQAHWPDAPALAYLPALIEHESCITLRHPRCWQPASRLKTAREEGAGLGQLTRAWSPDGSLRFDKLAELRAQHPALREIDWSNVYQRPDLQMRAIVLMSRDAYAALGAVPDPMQRLAMSDAAYNGGLGGVQRERRACQLASGCNPAQWWGHVERHCLKSRATMYAGRSACDINRHHVHDVLRVRLGKYEGWL